jgi:hypothetical protein
MDTNTLSSQQTTNFQKELNGSRIMPMCPDAANKQGDFLPTRVNIQRQDSVFGILRKKTAVVKRLSATRGPRRGYQDSDSFSTTSFLANTREHSSQRF